MPELTTIKNVQTPSGEWVTIRHRELVPDDDPRLPTKEEGYFRFEMGQPTPDAAAALWLPEDTIQAKTAAPPTTADTESTRFPYDAQPAGQCASVVTQPAPPPTPAAATVEVSSTPIPKTEPPLQAIRIEDSCMHSNDEYDDQYEDEQEDDDRPAPVTQETLDEIDDMSPSELNGLIETIDANEEWRDLREQARERTEQWLGAIKKADEAPRCQYIKTGGGRCGSPAIKDQPFCYFHGEARTQRKADETANLQEVPLLEDRLSLQVAITRLCAQLMKRTIDEKTGRVLLAALRLAQKNMGGDATLYGA